MSIENPLEDVPKWEDLTQEYTDRQEQEKLELSGLAPNSQTDTEEEPTAI